MSSSSAPRKSIIDMLGASASHNSDELNKLKELYE